MKYLLLIFSFFIIHCSLLAQQDSGFTHKAEAKNQMVNGLKEGKWCEFRAGGGTVTADSIKASFYTLTVYKAGKPYGIVRWYHKGGELKSEVPYTNGVENGVEKVYSGGKLWLETIYTNGKAGVTKTFDDSGKEIK
jgi:antitoxin component YwqK of YwqJK toxin-antitoxin module